MPHQDPKIKAVLFDFGMVLSMPRNPHVWSELASMTKLTEPELEHAYWLQRDDYDAGALTGEEFWSGIGASAGMTYSSQQLFDMNAGDVRLWGDLNEPMVAWVKQLHDSGIRTGILSNMGDRMAEGLVERFDWIGRFDHTVWSHALKLRKPQPEIYAAAATGLNTPPAQILFVDDKQENITAALNFGMQAILYSTHDRFEAEMAARGLSPL